MHRRRLLLIKSREKQQGQLLHRSQICITCQELSRRDTATATAQHKSWCIVVLFDDNIVGDGCCVADMLKLCKQTVGLAPW